jgi:hypothetical protein
MHSIGTIAVAAAGLGNLTAQLPWAWFALIAVVDAALVVVVINRRRAGRAVVDARSQAPSAETMVLRSGWSVPRSRALRVRPHPATYAWPLHSEYMVSRLV